MRSTLSLCLLTLAGVLVAPGARAGTVTLDFEDIKCLRSQARCDVGDQYAARGFALRHIPGVDDPMDTGLQGVGPKWKHNRKGSGALAISRCEAQVTLMTDDNAPFDALSIDLAELEGEGPTTVTFVGQKDDGTEVRQDIRLDGAPGWRTHRFAPEFKGLMSLQWAQADCLNERPHMLDNLTLSKAAKP